MDNSDFLQVCIANFGVAKNNNEIKQVTGTPLYMPPDYLFYFYERKPFHQKFCFDIYSLGIICFQLFSPFDTWRKYENGKKFIKKPKMISDYFDDYITNNMQNDIPDSVKNFILNCVNPYCSNRPSAIQCLEMANEWTDV